MKTKYFHLELGKEVLAPSGYYLLLEENILLYNGKKVFYVVGGVCIESSCCGSGSWNYIQVPGYLAEENIRVDKTGSSFSEIETIDDADDRAKITRLLEDKYPSARVEIG